MVEESKQKRQTLSRYAEILEIVASSGTVSLTQIAEMGALPKGTVHRLANALVDVGFLETVGAPRPLYTLGNRLLRLLHSGGSADLVERIATPFLEALADEFNESSFMTRLNGTQVEALIRIAPSKRISGYVVPGSVMPPHAAASAKAIVAYQSQELIDVILKAPLEKLTSFTKCDRDAIRSDYRQVRDSGYAVCDRELDDWLLAFAAPVIQRGGNVFYAVALSGPVSRLGLIAQSKIVSSLQNTAKQIAHEVDSRLGKERV